MSTSHRPLNNQIALIDLEPTKSEQAPEFNQLLGKSRAKGYLNFTKILKAQQNKTLIPPVDADIVFSAIHQCLSYRGRKLSSTEGINTNSDDKDLSRAIIVKAIQKDKFLMFRKVFFPPFKEWFRGKADFLQIFNVPIAAGLAVFELGFREIGTFLASLMFKGMRKAFDQKNSPTQRTVFFTAALTIGFPCWCIGQVFNTVGNTFSYARLTLDGLCNIFSSLIAYGDKDYPPLSTSIAYFCKNALLLSLNLIVFALVLLPGGQFVPAVANALAPIIAPLKGIVLSALTPFAVVTQAFIGTAIAALASITMQVLAGGVNTLFNKAKKWHYQSNHLNQQPDNQSLKERACTGTHIPPRGIQNIHGIISTAEQAHFTQKERISEDSRIDRSKSEVDPKSPPKENAVDPEPSSLQEEAQLNPTSVPLESKENERESRSPKKN